MTLLAHSTMMVVKHSTMMMVKHNTMMMVKQSTTMMVKQSTMMMVKHSTMSLVKHRSPHLPQERHPQLLCNLCSPSVAKNVCMVSTGGAHVVALVLHHAQDGNIDLAKHLYAAMGVNESDILCIEGPLGMELMHTI